MTLVEWTPSNKIERLLIEQHGSMWTEYKAPWVPERRLIGSPDGSKVHWVLSTQITEELTDDEGIVDSDEEHGA